MGVSNFGLGWIRGRALVGHCALVVLGCLTFSAGSFAMSQDQQGIHVSGRGEVLVEPDIARFTLNVTRQGRDAVALKKALGDKECNPPFSP